MPSSEVGQDRAVVAFQPRVLQETSPHKQRKPMSFPRGYLADWLGIFDDLAVEEMHTFVDHIMVAGRKWTYEKLFDTRAEVGRQSRSAIRRRKRTVHLGQDAKSSVHHLLASSRGGERRGNTVTLPRGFHSLWHQVFANLTVTEVHAFIDIVMHSSTKWHYETLRAAQITLMRHTAALKRRG